MSAELIELLNEFADDHEARSGHPDGVDGLRRAAKRIKELEEALKAMRDDVLTTAEETGREVVERETFQQACDALAKLEGK